MRRIEKPWGHELVWAHTARYVGKSLHIIAGRRLSLQFHRVKEESLFVRSGEVLVQLEDAAGVLQRHLLGPGATLHIPPGRQHRFEAITDCEMIEVSTPELDDVVRIDDDYGRAPAGDEGGPV